MDDLCSDTSDSEDGCDNCKLNLNVNDLNNSEEEERISEMSDTVSQSSKFSTTKYELDSE